MAVTEKDILAALQTVIDPDLHKDLVTLNQIKGIKIFEGAVSVQISTPSPLKDKLRQAVVAAVRRVPGVEEVYVDFAVSQEGGRGRLRRRVRRRSRRAGERPGRGRWLMSSTSWRLGRARAAWANPPLR